jgi:hypothetical protein
MLRVRVHELTASDVANSSEAITGTVEQKLISNGNYLCPVVSEMFRVRIHEHAASNVPNRSQSITSR